VSVRRSACYIDGRMSLRPTTCYAFVWEYVVRPERADEFYRTYGPHGAWVQLFSRAEGYVRTELFRDESRPNRFVTIDVWVSRDAHDAFRQRFSQEYTALDAQCEAYTLSERFVGDFSVES
jgi:quinol monooxygenase YgiN